MIELWNKIVRFFHRKRIAEIEEITEMYNSDAGLEDRLAQLHDRYGHLNEGQPFEPIYRPGEASTSSLETTTVVDDQTPVEKRVREILKMPKIPVRRWDDL